MCVICYCVYCSLCWVYGCIVWVFMRSRWCYLRMTVHTCNVNNTDCLNGYARWNEWKKILEKYCFAARAVLRESLLFRMVCVGIVLKIFFNSCIIRKEDYISFEIDTCNKNIARYVNFVNYFSISSLNLNI